MRIKTAVLVAVLLSCALFAFAQAEAPAPTTASTVPVNELVTAGTALLVWGLTEVFKRFATKLPRMVILSLPLVLSAVVMGVGAWLNSTPIGSWQNIVATILSAALATWGNEIKTTGAQWGLTGKPNEVPAPPTP